MLDPQKVLKAIHKHTNSKKNTQSQELAHILRAACRITVDQDVPVNSK